MRLERFIAEDYFKLEKQEGSGLENWMSSRDIPWVLLALEEYGASRSLWFGGKLYAIFGVLEIRLGVGEVYFIPSKDWIKKKKSVCKFVKKDLELLTKLFMRIQMTCLEDDVFLRFSDFFGFKKEGSLKYFDKFGRTYSMLAITRGVI